MGFFQQDPRCWSKYVAEVEVVERNGTEARQEGMGSRPDKRRGLNVSKADAAGQNQAAQSLNRSMDDSSRHPKEVI